MVVRHEMMEVAKFLTELAVIDYHFAPLKPSSVGLAALLTAMEGVSEDRLAMVNKRNFADKVYEVADVSPNDPEVMDCRTRLRTMYYEGREDEIQQEIEALATAQANREHMLATERIAAESPTGVDAHPTGQTNATEAHGGQPILQKNINGSWGLDAATSAVIATSLSSNNSALNTAKTNGISSASSSPSTSAAATTNVKTTETENEVITEVTASKCPVIVGKAKKLLRDAICPSQNTWGAKKRRKN